MKNEGWNDINEGWGGNGCSEGIPTGIEGGNGLGCSEGWMIDDGTRI